MIVLAVTIKLLSLNKTWVEEVYYGRIYPAIGSLLRIAFGWIPFSIGDIIYVLFFAWLLWKLFFLIKKLFQKRVNKHELLRITLKGIKIALIIYIIFYGFWGMNYTRKGIAYQLQLDVKEYTKQEVILLDSLLRQKTNLYKAKLSAGNTKPDSYQEVFKKAYQCYDNALTEHPYFKYENRSIKPVFLGNLGAYLGFIGHYDPFTGEAQVNTTIPECALPFTTCHEIAHQIGYAKEYEANFAAYIAAQHSNDDRFLYSTYLDLYLYANGELFKTDSLLAKQSRVYLIEPVQKDLRSLKAFKKDHETFLEPISEKFYSIFLQLNEQPAGLRSYNKVVLWLIAYYKKHGSI